MYMVYSSVTIVIIILTVLLNTIDYINIPQQFSWINTTALYWVTKQFTLKRKKLFDSSLSRINKTSQEIKILNLLWLKLKYLIK